MSTPESLQQLLNKAFSKIEFPGTPAELYDPVSYTLQLGGKRLRPFLVLASCEMFGGNLDDAIHPAIAIELFHNFTLLHDDLMDQAPLRRGKATVYKKWNANIAILSGDTMFALANRYMLQTRNEAIPVLLDIFNQTAIEVCEGQQYDMNYETRDDVSISEYMNMIRLKTAVLLACSLKIGAIIAGAGSRSSDSLYSFGINIGIAFQLMDDLLDVYGSEDKFGKVTGGDIVAGKKTFLYLKALELSGSQGLEFTNLYQSRSLPNDQKISAVRAHFDQLGINEITREEISNYWNNAVSILNSIDLPSDKSQLLVSYCTKLMDRDS
jgi:geranylgeranyl diphosphate synthase, type II